MGDPSSKEAQVAAKTGRQFLIFTYFKEPALENLYENFSLRQKRTGLESFIVAILLSGLNVVSMVGLENIAELVSVLVFVILDLFLLVLCRKGYNNNKFWAIIPHICCHVANVQLIFFSRHSLAWVLLFNFLIYISLPLQLRFCLMFSIVTCLSYTYILYGSSKTDSNILQQVKVCSDSAGPIHKNITGETTVTP
ncbi:hypothetical protein WA026_022877 [Henosepilachna vigintioctopunctata]|uniref:Uncharacterized protein n=1 Tax=Henosepilachna vigintioctopunctata TaxID=420089 RepID=A0AAW1UD31_9CUCU